MPNTIETFNIMKESRKEKYLFLRGLGFHWLHCRRMRDWRWTKLYRYLDIPLPEGLMY